MLHRVISTIALILLAGGGVPAQAQIDSTWGPGLSGTSSRLQNLIPPAPAPAPAPAPGPAPAAPFSSFSSCEYASRTCTVEVVGATAGRMVDICRMSPYSPCESWSTANASGGITISFPTSCGNFGLASPCSISGFYVDSATGQQAGFSYGIAW